MPQALYPGTFDPITRGHIDILKRAVEIFGTVEVAVSEEPPKSTLLSARERALVVRRAVADIDGVSVESFTGLLVEHARARGAAVLIRGLRQGGDFEHEYQMAVANREMCPEVETVCLFTSSRYNYISSTIVREIYRHAGDLSPFIPEIVRECLIQKRETGKID